MTPGPIEHAELKSYNSFAVSARCRALFDVDSIEALDAAIDWSEQRDLPWLLLGEGSNVLFVGDYPGSCIRLRLTGIQHEMLDDNCVRVTAGAGENWHQLVRICLDQGWHGIENLALIPGSVGAAPVQNIGAYGVELSDVLESVEIHHIESRRNQRLAARDCHFAYRDSVFKGELKGRVVITAIHLVLRKQSAVVAHYPSLQEELQRTGGPVTPATLFEAVCRIRQRRLPDPAQLGNAGSFFKNPVIGTEQLEQLRQEYPELPAHAMDGSAQHKVPAAWLIEKAGWKGFRADDAGVHSEQALVLVNHGSANGQAILDLAERIMESIRSRFDINLEPEVRIIARES